MFDFGKKIILASLFSLSSLWAFQPSDEIAIQSIIQNYTDSWNLHEGKGFADGYSENADFVNIFGMKFSGKAEIEERHVKILKSFFKGSKLEIVSTALREAQEGVVIGTIQWRLKGFRSPGADMSKPAETREGIYTQVFIHSNNKWEITASQNTLMN